MALDASKRYRAVLTFFAVLGGLASAWAAGDGRALVIIDMQPHFVTRGGEDGRPENQKKVQEITEAQLAAIAEAEKAQIPIILIEYAGEGSTNDALKAATKNYGKTAYFLKTTDGFFDEGNSHRQELQQYLTRENVHNLIISGANGGACVERSIRGALENHFNVMAYNNGIADFNYRDFIYPYVYNVDLRDPSSSDVTFRQADKLTEVFSPFPASSAGPVPSAGPGPGSNLNAGVLPCPSPNVENPIEALHGDLRDILGE